MHDDVDGHALLDLVRLRHHPVDNLVEIVALGLREETDAAEVDAEHRHAGGAGELGAAQQRAVTAENDEQFTAVEALRSRLLDQLHLVRQRQVGRLRLEDAYTEA
ncbi:hypothetical protein SAV14893_061380 [Streptomyces avermitilis]|uniref:Uncharacterized protein n=1 Tax=Streptomyces avermitilis TaxID=33903 RepID=A0A4D4M4F5_STRAX|nr:hypothetical protein SAVMC3_73800 [Streptomyces avermitilis]GDY66745.1 hypothetical protein SAV14893_061380 [Streptomyces avermitilis]GDY82119.1 hypothetical protein SAVCW2_13180 [Streptomyces avermitilis]